MSDTHEPASRRVYAPDEVLESLDNASLPHTYCHGQLLESHKVQRSVVRQMKSGISSIEAVDILLTNYLKSLFQSISGIPGGIRYNQLEISILKSGLLQPFISDIDLQTKGLEIGLPTDSNALCDNLSEVVRVTAAAFCAKWHYLNFKQQDGIIPSDDASLLFCTLGLRSLSNKAIAEAFNARVSELGITGFSAGECKWLLCWIRQGLSGWFAAVQYLLGDQRCDESLEAQQFDQLSMIKHVPTCPLGYLLYSRSCLGFQQHRAAFAFADKGIIISNRVGDDLHRAQLLCIRAVARLLGGAGDKYKPSELAHNLLEACQLIGHVKQWLPECYHDLLTLRPEDGILKQRVLSIQLSEGQQKEEVPFSEVLSQEELQAIAAASGEDVAALDAVYTTAAPSELPVGAITQLSQGGAAADAQLEVVPED